MILVPSVSVSDAAVIKFQARRKIFAAAAEATEASFLPMLFVG